MMTTSNSPYLCVYNTGNGRVNRLDNVEFGSLGDYPSLFGGRSIINTARFRNNCHHHVVDRECEECYKEICVDEGQSSSELRTKIDVNSEGSVVIDDLMDTDVDIFHNTVNPTQLGDTLGNSREETSDSLQSEIPESIIREIGMKSDSIFNQAGYFEENGYIEQSTETNNWYWYMITCRPNYVNINNRDVFEQKLLEISEPVLVEALQKLGIHSLLTSCDNDNNNSDTNAVTSDSTNPLDEKLEVDRDYDDLSDEHINYSKTIKDDCLKKYKLALDRKKILSKDMSLPLLDEIYQISDTVTIHNARNVDTRDKRNSNTNFRENKSTTIDRKNKEKKYVLILLVYYHQLLNYDPEKLDDQLSSRLMESIVPFIDRTVLYECTNNIHLPGNTKSSKAINKATGNRTILELDSNPEITLARYNESIDKYYTLPHDKAQGSPLQYFFQYFLGISDFDWNNPNNTEIPYSPPVHVDVNSTGIGTTVTRASKNHSDTLKFTCSNDTGGKHMSQLKHSEKYVKKPLSNSGEIHLDESHEHSTCTVSHASHKYIHNVNNTVINSNIRITHNSGTESIGNTTPKKQSAIKCNNSSKLKMSRSTKNRTSSGSIRKRNFSNSSKVSSRDIEKLGRITTLLPLNDYDTQPLKSFTSPPCTTNQHDTMSDAIPILGGDREDTTSHEKSTHIDETIKDNLEDFNLQADPTRFRHNLALVVDFGTDLEAAKEFHKAIGTRTRGKTRFSVVMYYLSRINRPNYTCFFSILGTQLYFHAIKYNHDLMTLEVLSLNK